MTALPPSDPSAPAPPAQAAQDIAPDQAANRAADKVTGGATGEAAGGATGETAGAEPPVAPPVAPLPRAAFSTLRRRKEFLAAANRGRNCATPGLMLQARLRPGDEPAETPVRIGYTCSKKVGNAVARNRAKRRLRAAAAAAMPAAARAGWDYVLVGRAAVTAARPFAELVEDLAGGIARLHAREDEGRPERPRPPSGRRGKGGGKGGKGGKDGKGGAKPAGHPAGKPAGRGGA